MFDFDQPDKEVSVRESDDSQANPFVAAAGTGESEEAGEADEESEEAPAAGEEEEPLSEPADEAGQTAEESDPEEEEQQEEEKPQRPNKRGGKLSRRMRELTGKIAELQARLDQQQPEAEEEVEEEAASSTEEEAAAEEPVELVRPKWSDFEDTEEKTAQEQYEEALEKYNDAKTAKKIADALAQRDEQHAKARADEEWTRQAARFADYNEVVKNDSIQVSPAMIEVLKRDPQKGTELSYYLGKNPEVAKRIAEATLARNAAEWKAALITAAEEFGELRAAIKAEAKAKEAAPANQPPAAKKPAAPAPAAQPATKKVSTASPPPPRVRGVAAPSKPNLYDDEFASDFNKWEREREAQLQRK